MNIYYIIIIIITIIFFYFIYKQSNKQSINTFNTIHNFISDDEKSSVEKGLQDADARKLVSHSKARKLYDKWL